VALGDSVQQFWWQKTNYNAEETNHYYFLGLQNMH
jgi:hypothetical protein